MYMYAYWKRISMFQVRNNFIELEWSDPQRQNVVLYICPVMLGWGCTAMLRYGAVWYRLYAAARPILMNRLKTEFLEFKITRRVPRSIHWILPSPQSRRLVSGIACIRHRQMTLIGRQWVQCILAFPAVRPSDAAVASIDAAAFRCRWRTYSNTSNSILRASFISCDFCCAQKVGKVGPVFFDLPPASRPVLLVWKRTEDRANWVHRLHPSDCRRRLYWSWRVNGRSAALVMSALLSATTGLAFPTGHRQFQVEVLNRARHFATIAAPSMRTGQLIIGVDRQTDRQTSM